MNTQSGLDAKALARLRARFLEGAAPAGDYWSDEALLTGYDATFAQRIGWKWDYVLHELQRRGWTPPPGDVLDWGCGSGIAGRAFADHFGAPKEGQLCFSDASARAVQFAARRARGKYPGARVLAGQPERAAVLLVSHVLTELAPPQLEALLAGPVAAATCCLWVEPGTRQASRALLLLRERLRGRFHVVAPCTHQAACGLLAPDNARHWCHHFAPSPPAVFTDGDWARFAAATGIDLRSLPLSFLVLDQRPAAPMPPGATRIVGRPRVYKGHTLLFGCDEAGVRDRRVAQRRLPEDYRRAAKGQTDPLQLWECAGAEVLSARPLFGVPDE